MIKKLINVFKLFTNRKRNDKIANLLTASYFNGKTYIPLIVFDKSRIVSSSYIYPSHYCKDERVNSLVKYCKEHGISMFNHGKREKVCTDGTVRYWNYISLHINGRYVSGQCFHRILTTAMQADGIDVKPYNMLNK